jgi:hypothetical protein
MPEAISVKEFIDETRDDFHSPTTSTFVSKIPHCRNAVNNLEEVCCSNFYTSTVELYEGALLLRSQAHMCQLFSHFSIVICML